MSETDKNAEDGWAMFVVFALSSFASAIALAAFILGSAALLGFEFSRSTAAVSFILIFGLVLVAYSVGVFYDDNVEPAGGWRSWFSSRKKKKLGPTSACMVCGSENIEEVSDVEKRCIDCETGMSFKASFEVTPMSDLIIGKYRSEPSDDRNLISKIYVDMLRRPSNYGIPYSAYCYRCDFYFPLDGYQDVNLLKEHGNDEVFLSSDGRIFSSKNKWLKTQISKEDAKSLERSLRQRPDQIRAMSAYIKKYRSGWTLHVDCRSHFATTNIEDLTKRAIWESDTPGLLDDTEVVSKQNVRVDRLPSNTDGFDEKLDKPGRIATSFNLYVGGIDPCALNKSDIANVEAKIEDRRPDMVVARLYKTHASHAGHGYYAVVELRKVIKSLTPTG